MIPTYPFSIKGCYGDVGSCGVIGTVTRWEVTVSLILFMSWLGL